MASFLRAQAAILMDNALGEDVIVNTWHFNGDTIAVTDAELALDYLETFYTAIDGVIYPTTIQNACTIKVYDLTDEEPRVPVDERTFEIIPTANNALPHEVAVCLSYRGELVSGEIAARRRGRIYLGPITSTAVTVANGASQVSAAVRDAIAVAAGALRDSPSTKWSVFSPTTLAAPGGDLATAFNDVVTGYVDNAFDTMQSRGQAATLRSNF